MAETRHEFPAKPHNISDYWDVARGEPRVERRWLKFRAGAQVLDIYYRGMCIRCSMGVYSLADGSTIASMGNQSLTPLSLDDGTMIRACWRCATEEFYANETVEAAKRMLEADPKANVGPLVWPSLEERKAKAEAKAKREAEADDLVPLAV